MLNRVILIGRLTRDPELRYTQSGIPVVSFSLAVDRPFTNQTTGERETDFIDIVAWRKLAETCANHLGKGRLVGLEGSLRVRSYEATDGQKRKVSEVVAENIHFLDKPREGAGAGVGSGAQRPAAVPAGPPVTSGGQSFDTIDLDDDVPF